MTRIPHDVDTDYYALADFLSEEDRDLVERVRSFVRSDLAPVINDYWEQAQFPHALLPAFVKTGVVGTTVRGYGAPGLNRFQAGLVAMELSRGDGSFNTVNAVQSGLVMGTIDRFGDDEQKARWLPALARMEKLGAFGLTEPLHGSDSVRLETTARRSGDGYLLSGAKRWIGMGDIADVVIIWARDESDGKVRGFVVEETDGRYPDGFEAAPILGKIGKRAIPQADITLDDVFVPAGDRLAHANSFRDVSAVLSATRSTVAWEALGHATAAYEIAARYAQTREQFGRPIASFQLVQHKLAKMLAELTSMQLMCFRSATLQDDGRFSNAQASLLKMHVCDKARDLCREARDMLGGNGLLLENDVARHLTDMEVVHTYEGTDSIQSLIVGRDITGIAAFA
ncbi:acyl-CoA dehydrogenase family protein [Streptomyces sp. 3214.6]|uniref:acyl-CoA dehydrogenase family protein n=1 Tax=Streptomyces sp. 3214.6 TaxID=1882757 RepID=UPI00090B23EE|nr:acyl-CoA dehydrogenase family protein [Streptomyces sp. 3214.6]SHH29954.1 glutaryl-CoA dehydrogenase [Streptomyces sp. 3214.6]